MFKLLLFAWLFIIIRGDNTEYKNYAHGTACGETNPMGLRIVGGIHAEKAEFPWMVSIMRKGRHFCGGSIISEKFVLTAAHCLCNSAKEYLPPNVFKLFLAQHVLSDKNSDAFEVTVNEIFIYPGYNCSVSKDDIAILKLVSEIKWTPVVAPVCVSSEKNHHAYEDMLVTVTGWGWTDEDRSKGQLSDQLRKTYVLVIKTDTCRQWYREQKKRTKILDTHICAGYESGGIDACWADSGGPLMKKLINKTVLIGIVSTGRGCGRPFLPGLYTRISEYITWIEDIIGYY